MSIPETILSSLTAVILANSFFFFLISVIATAIWGDASYIFLVILGVQSHIPLILIALSAFIGTIIGDTIWFFIGIRFIKKLKKKKALKKTFLRISRTIEKTFGNRYTLALTTVKFLYGTRVITIFYLADKKLRYKKFIMYNIIATFFWVIGVGAIGWLAGIGFSYIVNVFKNLQLAILGLIVLFLIIAAIQKKITKILEK